VSRVLVAGGAGFIGSHLIDRLVDRGDSVVCVDDLSTGSRDNVAVHAEVRFVEGDITEAATIDRVTHGGRFDGVFHLASPASPPAYLVRRIATLDVGSIGTRRLLELADRDGARFLMASTSEVYGDPLVHPQREDYRGNVNPIGERSCYDEAKRFAEALTVAYAHERGVDACIARIFNTYGPRMQPDDGRVITNFIHQALTGDPLTVYGDGSQTRSFCYVDDLVRGLLALFDSREAGPVNLGNPTELTVRELATLIAELVGVPARFVDAPLPSDDPKVRRPDITLAVERLGWSPTVSLRDGLRRTIAAFAAARDVTAS